MSHARSPLDSSRKRDHVSGVNTDPSSAGVRATAGVCGADRRRVLGGACSAAATASIGPALGVRGGDRGEVSGAGSCVLSSNERTSASRASCCMTDSSASACSRLRAQPLLAAMAAAATRGTSTSRSPFGCLSSHQTKNPKQTSETRETDIHDGVPLPANNERWFSRPADRRHHRPPRCPRARPSHRIRPVMSDGA